MNEDGRTAAKAVADGGKSPEAFRTIGEVSRALSIQPHVLRYWEEQFPMLRPVKRAGGRRLYRPEDMELLVTIDRLVHREGLTLRGARKWLQSRGKSDAVIESAPEDKGQLLSDLMALRDQLRRALT